LVLLVPLFLAQRHDFKKSHAVGIGLGASKLAPGTPEPDAELALPGIQKEWQNLQSLKGGQGLGLGQYFKELAQFGSRHGTAAVPFLRGLLTDSDWQVRGAVLRALGATGSPEAEAILQQFIRPDAILEDAAQATLALGEMEDPAITGWLKERWKTMPDGDLRRCLLDTLAGRPYAQTEDFFPAFLQNAKVDPQAKASVLSNLGFHQEAPLPLLTPFLASGDATLRAGAYDAMIFRPEARLGQQLIRQATQETEPALRGKAYEAAGHQLDVAAQQMAAVAAGESDPAARLRAERAWGMAVGRSENFEERRMFDAEAVPRLVIEALQNPDPGEQRAALQALAMARTVGAKDALLRISRESPSPRLARLAENLWKKLSGRDATIAK
jgi:HEAT repeat protein